MQSVVPMQHHVHVLNRHAVCMPAGEERIAAGDQLSANALARTSCACAHIDGLLLCSRAQEPCVACLQERSVSLWAIIRECVGKDLTRVCLPVYFNEPLSALQKLAEDLEYCGLLDQARCSLVLVQHTSV